MSTDLTRIIEVKLPDINGYVYKEEDLKNITANDGDIYRVNWDINHKYRVYHCDSDNDTGYWEQIDDCEYKWHLVKYWGNNEYGYDHDDNPEKIFGSNIKLREITEFTNCGGSIRDRYLSKWYDEYHYYDRGIPKDISDECKALLHIGEPRYCWGHTFVLLSEWCDLYNSELEKFKSLIKETIFKSELKTINEKLDKIYNKISDIPEVEDESSADDTELTDIVLDGEYVETLDDIFNDEYDNVDTLHTEIIKVYTLVHELYGFVPEENIRINYYFS